MSNQSTFSSLDFNTTVATTNPAAVPSYSIHGIYYVGFVASIFGSLTNILCVLVFIHPKLKDSTFKFMLADSVVDLGILVISGINVTLTCGNVCMKNYNSYIGQVFSLWFVNYFARSLAVLNILIEIFVSLQRLMLIKNKRFLKDASVIKVLVILTVISFIYYLPAFFSQKIGQTYSPLVFLPNSTKVDMSKSRIIYFGTSTEFGTSQLGKLMIVVLTIVRIFFATVVLLSINILSALHFRRHIKKKSIMSQKSNITSKYTRKIFFYNFLRFRFVSLLCFNN